MNEALFDVVFKGKFVNQIDKSKAVLHFSKLFKMPETKAKLFFDGKPRSLKKSVNLEKASQFRTALKKAGLRVSLVKKIDEEAEQAEQGLSMSEPGVVIINKPFVQPKHFETSQFELDEVGVEIVHVDKIEPLEFDLADLDLDEVGVQIIEKPTVLKADIDVSNITVDEVGATFAEKPDIPEPTLDISDLSMDEVGVVLVEKEKIPELEINTDKIKLAD